MIVAGNKCKIVNGKLKISNMNLKHLGLFLKKLI